MATTMARRPIPAPIIAGYDRPNDGKAREVFYQHAETSDVTYNLDKALAWYSNGASVLVWNPVIGMPVQNTDRRETWVHEITLY